jgi:N-acyl homoserine lactone hydrolase
MKYELESKISKNLVKVLIKGVHKVEQNKLPHHTGAVTYIRFNNKNILIDTGSRGRKTELISELSELGLTVNDIDLVVLTHFHMDHAFNVMLFENATVVGWNHIWQSEYTERIGELDFLKADYGIELFRTPGHAEEHLSVLFEIDGTKVVISGDAINEHFYNTGLVNVFTYDESLYIQSANTVKNFADVIIPGHGEAIFNK